MKKKILAALAAVATLSCYGASPPAEQAEANPVYVYTTYYHCDNATLPKADETFARLYKPVLNRLIADHTLLSWGWLGHNTGGDWGRAAYIAAPGVNAALAATFNVHASIDRPPPKVQFDQACGSAEDYIWHMLAGNDAHAHRGNAAFSVYYVCDQSREQQADALMKRVFAPMYDRLVAEGKLTSWGWAEHIVGGKYRRLATMTAPTVDALMTAREGIVTAAEHDPLNDVFTSICGSHQDYIWDVMEQAP